MTGGSLAEIPWFNHLSDSLTPNYLQVSRLRKRYLRVDLSCSRRAEHILAHSSRHAQVYKYTALRVVPVTV